MSDRLPNPDEVVSAYLDGEATPSETALVERDAVLMAQVEELQAVRDAVATRVPSLPAARREQLIGAALAAADETPASGGVVVPLRRFSQPFLAVAAAAVVLAAVVGAGLLASRNGGGDAETASMDVSATTADTAGSDDDAASAPTAEMAEPAAEMAEATEAPADMAPAEADMAAEESMAYVASGVEEPADEFAMAEDSSGGAEPAATTTTHSAGAPVQARDAEEASPEEAAAAETAGLGEPAAENLVVDLGLLNSIDSLVDLVAARVPVTAKHDDPPGQRGVCSAAVEGHAREMGAEAMSSFVAVLDGLAPTSLDAMLVSRDDGTAWVLYAVEPDCAPGLLGLDGTAAG